MDALAERVEVLATGVVAYDDLAVEHVTPGGQHELGEVAPERLAVARLQEAVFAVDEGEAAKAVELDLVDVLLADRQLLARQRQLRLDGRAQRERRDSPCLGLDAALAAPDAPPPLRAPPDAPPPFRARLGCTR